MKVVEWNSCHFLNLFSDKPGSNNRVWVNAYFDTHDGKMSGDCQCPIGNDNCNNIIKHYDGTVFDLSNVATCHFHGNPACIAAVNKKKNNKMTGLGCHRQFKLICLFDCCKFNSFFI